MNPFLQANWSDVRTRLIGYIADALSDDLPLDLTARAEERVVLEEPGEKNHVYRADVAIVEPWRAGLPPIVNYRPGAEDGTVLTVADPLIFTADGEVERWVEIHDVDGSLITVIEVLSPANKRDPGNRAYLDRRYYFQSSGVHMVEIDLLRGGAHVVSVPEEKLRPKYPPGTCHLVCTTRLFGDDARWEVYLCPLRQVLPVIRVPLRRGEPDVALALQPLVDRCYRTGRYWLSPTVVSALHPPPADAEEAAWIEERLRAAGPA